MTSAEFAAARAKLGLSPDALADELVVTVPEVEAWERGDARVSKRVAQHLTWLVGMRDYNDALAAAGHAPCPVLAEMDAGVPDDADPDAILALGKRLEQHVATCAVCQARRAYAEQHLTAPPMPSMGATARFFGAVADATDRLPAFIRPPADASGEGRRIGIFAAVFFSLLATAILGFGAGAQAMGGRGREALDSLRMLPLVAAAYFVGFFLAGWGFDVTRGIRHRFHGYVLRGGIAALAIYGSMSFAVSYMDRGRSGPPALVLFASLATVGMLIGAGLWIVERVRGRVPGADR